MKMMKKLLIVSTLFIPAVAYAQQPDATFLQPAVTALQSQRNAALDAQAVAEAKVAGNKLMLMLVCPETLAPFFCHWN